MGFCFERSLGAYTVTAYAVAQRTREYGIRLALGETPASIGRRALTSASYRRSLAFWLAAGLR